MTQTQTQTEETQWLQEGIAREAQQDTQLEQHYELQHNRYRNVAPCPRCGSPSGQWRGYRHTKKHGVTHRRRCNQCGKWHQKPRR